jgi:hypothetical protein
MKAMINQYLFFVHDKFTKLGMHAPQGITKWHIQLMHILSDIAFLIPARFEFL